MNYAGILAAGSGRRMGATERPKQFLRLGGEPVIVRTLRAFLDCECIDKVVVAVNAAWMEYTRVLVAENFDASAGERVHVVAGGAERSDSLECICEFIECTFGLGRDDVLVSHDAVRPFVTERIISENVVGAREAGCVDTVVPATDTIVVSADGTEIDDIPPRARYYQGQTPQSFRICEYRELFAALSGEQRAQLTDACKVYVLNERPVRLVMGEYGNIKITTPHDVHVAESILGSA